MISFRFKLVWIMTTKSVWEAVERKIFTIFYSFSTPMLSLPLTLQSPISPLFVHFQMDDDEPPSSIWMTNECTSRLRGKYPKTKDKTFLLLYQTSIMDWWNLTIAGISENFIRERSNSFRKTNERMNDTWMGNDNYQIVFYIYWSNRS